MPLIRTQKNRVKWPKSRSLALSRQRLAKAIISKFPNTVYLDLERPSDLNKLQDAETFLLINKDKLVCIDEIQLRPDLFSVLRSIIDLDRRNGRFLLLGSSAPELLRQSSQSLAGRISYHEVSSLLWNEVSTSDSFHSDSWMQYLLRGGFPESYLADNDERSSRWRESYIKTFLERDLRQFGVEVSPQKIRRLWLMCAHLNGQTLNYSKLGQSLDQTHPTIKAHLDILESMFMIRRLPVYEVNLKKRLVKSPKLFFRDSGVLTSLLEIDHFEDLFSHPTYGSAWEGCAIENILQRYKPKGMFGFFRTHGGEEIDLVLNVKDRLIGFEFKTSSTPKLSKENIAAKELLNLQKLFVVVPSGDSYPIKGEDIWVSTLSNLPEIL
jgi:predicted AAA+ superfamily ATPase